MSTRSYLHVHVVSSTTASEAIQPSTGGNLAPGSLSTTATFTKHDRKSTYDNVSHRFFLLGKVRNTSISSYLHAHVVASTTAVEAIQHWTGVNLVPAISINLGNFHKTPMPPPRSNIHAVTYRMAKTAVLKNWCHHFRQVLPFFRAFPTRTGFVVVVDLE